MTSGFQPPRGTGAAFCLRGGRSSRWVGYGLSGVLRGVTEVGSPLRVAEAGTPRGLYLWPASDNMGARRSDGTAPMRSRRARLRTFPVGPRGRSGSMMT